MPLVAIFILYWSTFFKQQFLWWIFFLAPVLEIYKEEDFCSELVGPINIKVVTTPLIYLKILCIKRDQLSIKKKKKKKGSLEIQQSFLMNSIKKRTI